MTQEEILIAYRAGKLTIFEVLKKLDELKITTQKNFSERPEKDLIFSSLIFENILSPLSLVPHHNNIECIERFFSDQFPAHLAIHRINNAMDQIRNYMELHTHEEQEINIIISDSEKGLVYEIQIGNEIYNVKSNSSIWIPSNIPHSSNVMRGSGYFIVLRLAPDPSIMEKLIQNFNSPSANSLCNKRSYEKNN